MDLEEKVIQTLTENKQNLAVAESLTGGLIMASLVSVPGASQVLKGGFVTYQTKAKVEWLHIDASLIDRFGVVSQEVALLMAEKMLEISQCDYALGITGYAGPSVDEEEQVGDVYIALASQKQTTQGVFLALGNLDRQAIREQAKDTALNLLLTHITK